MNWSSSETQGHGFYLLWVDVDYLIAYLCIQEACFKRLTEVSTSLAIKQLSRIE